MELLPAQSQQAFYQNNAQMYTTWNLIALNGGIPNLTGFSNLPDLEITPVVNTSASLSRCESNGAQYVDEGTKKHQDKEQADIENLLKRLPLLNQNFKLTSKIGQGSFSTVYLATLRNSPNSKKYAVKHLTQDLDKTRIDREWRCMREIGGRDNVVYADHYLQSNNCVAFVMPYLPHTRFSDYVLDMDVNETRLYMKNLFIALRRVHSFNVIHRDVKPGNFLYDRINKKFLLVDFGLAQLVQNYYPEPKKQETQQIDENMPIDYSKKRKRKPSTSDDERTTPVKRDCKRIALKAKDSNQNIENSIQETRLNENVPRQDFKSPIKKLPNKSSVEKTPLKSRTFSPASCPTSSRKKLFDEDNSKRDGNIGTSMLRAQLEMKMTSTSTDRSFTPLVANKSPTGSFVQVQNSRVVRQQTIATNQQSPASVFQKPNTIRPSCLCAGKAAICSICANRKKMHAPRAGTPGFRPPEVLCKYPYQTTAVDMWASGIILLCILSGCYPFFQSPSDLAALAEIMTIFGTDSVQKVANKLGRRIVCSDEKKGVDLKKLCIRLRSRSKKPFKSQKSSSEEVKKCQDCLQAIKKDGCLCLSENNEEPQPTPTTQKKQMFPDSAFHLLTRLLDLDPSTRITAAEALEHPFITEM